MYGFPLNLIVYLFPSVKRRPRPPRPCRSLPALTFQKYNPRIAYLVGPYKHDPALGRFSDLYSPEILLHRPHVLCGSGTLLCRLARGVAQGVQRPIPLRYGVVVQHRSPEEALTPQQRDLLWRVFQVPIFEQIALSNGTVLASECDAHEGLHIADERVSRIVGDHNLVSTPCACGTPGLRFRPYRGFEMVLAAPAVAAAAAVATPVLVPAGADAGLQQAC